MINKIIKKGKNVYIKKPKFNELNYIKTLWNDKETMGDVGGVINFDEERWISWYERMVYPGDNKNFYTLIYNFQDIPIGEVSFHGYDDELKSADLNVKIQSNFRRRGYGVEAINLMLDYYFNEFGGEVIFDNVMNTKGIEALKKVGFSIVEEKENEVLFRMTKEEFNTMRIDKQ